MEPKFNEEPIVKSVENKNPSKIMFGIVYPKGILEPNTFKVESDRKISIEENGFLVEELNADYPYGGENYLFVCNPINNSVSLKSGEKIIFQSQRVEERVRYKDGSQEEMRYSLKFSELSKNDFWKIANENGSFEITDEEQSSHYVKDSDYRPFTGAYTNFVFTDSESDLNQKMIARLKKDEDVELFPPENTDALTKSSGENYFYQIAHQYIFEALNSYNGELDGNPKEKKFLEESIGNYAELKKYREEGMSDSQLWYKAIILSNRDDLLAKVVKIISK